MVTIHEFSTGLRAQIASEGSWFSNGFTAEYMNVTLYSIPKGVRRAIANQLFAVVEGRERENPAVIAREVLDPEEQQWWCVVALVNEGKDDGGRPISVTRYFLTEGKYNLWKILAWMEQVKEETGKLPMFNPNERRSVGNPLTVDVQRQAEIRTLPESLRNNRVVRLNDEYTLQDINYFVEQRTQGNACITWAANIEALEKPNDFTLIQAANDEALERIRRQITESQAIVPQTIALQTFDENRMEQVISTIIGRDSGNGNTFRTLGNAFNEENVSGEIWDDLFNGEGANRVISENIHSDRMARLLSLRIFAPFDEEVIRQYITDLIILLKLTPQLQTVCDNTIRNFVRYNPYSDRLKETLRKDIKFRFYQLYRNQCEDQDIIDLLALGGEDGPWTQYLQRRENSQNPYQNNFIYDILFKLERETQTPGSNTTQDISGSNSDYVEMWEPLVEYITRNRSIISTPGQQQLSVEGFNENRQQRSNNISLLRLGDDIPKNTLNTGINDITQTKESLKELAESILLEYNNNQSEIGSNRKYITRQIIKTIILSELSILKIIENLLSQIITPILEQKVNKFLRFIYDPERLQHREKQHKSKQLVKAIYYYQKKHELRPNGRLNTDTTGNNENSGQSTVEKIKSDVIHELRKKDNIFPKEMATAIRKFTTTKNSLKQLINSIKSENSNAEEEKIKACQRISQQLSKYIPLYLKFKINLEVEIIINNVPDNSDTRNKNKNWIQAIAFYQNKHNITNEKYGILEEGNTTYNKLLEKLSKNILPQYKSFAQLFKKLEQYKLAAYFYQVSKGEVEAKIYDKAFTDSQIDFLGIRIKRKSTLIEKIVKWFRILRKIIRKVIVAIVKVILAILTVALLLIISPFILLASLLLEFLFKVLFNDEVNDWIFIFIFILLLITSFPLTGRIIYISIYRNSSPEERPQMTGWFASKLKPIGNSLSNFKFWTPENIKPQTLEASIPKFPVTINSFQETERKVINNEGYEIKQEVIYSMMLDEICLVIVREKVEENQGKNCLDFSILNKNEEEIQQVPKEEKEEWAKTVYSYEYENRKEDFTLDGVIDPNEQEIFQERVVKTLDNSFEESTRIAIEDLASELQSETELNLTYIESALRRIFKADSYNEPIKQQWAKGKKNDEIHKRKRQGKWIEGIYDFQVTHELDPSTITYGVIEKDDPTYEKLKEIAINKLTTPETVMTTAIQQFSTTQKGIDNVKKQVYDNLIADKGLRDKLTEKYESVIDDINNGSENSSIISDIETEIKSVLRKNLFFKSSADIADTIDDTERKKWVDAIYVYQKYKLNFKSPDGVMSPDGKTAKPLIEEITKRMKDKIQQ